MSVFISEYHQWYKKWYTINYIWHIVFFLYDIFVRFRYQGDNGLVNELATHNKTVAFGETIECPELPTVDGYTFSIWAMKIITSYYIIMIALS